MFTNGNNGKLMAVPIDAASVSKYLREADLSMVPGWRNHKLFAVLPLACGEYNLNYLVRQGSYQWVFRVNLGSQINRKDQIQYEYNALCQLAPTGLTPKPYFVDDTKALLTQGILMMEYLPGESLKYERDLVDAAKLFAKIHTQTAKMDPKPLIKENQPLTMTYMECKQLMQVYFNSSMGLPEIKSYLHSVIEWAKKYRLKESMFTLDPWSCMINTEVNSGNFIRNMQTGELHLVDWEKPLWGDPSQDLSHFCAPTTTLWKTEYLMNKKDRQIFMNAYQDEIQDDHLRETIEARVSLRDPFNALRGISWSAMAWVKYQTGGHTLKNKDTFKKIQQYLQPDFLHHLFDPFLG